MKKYQITFKINNRPQKWDRFGLNIEATLGLAKKAIESEWPGVKPHELNIRGIK